MSRSGKNCAACSATGFGQYGVFAVFASPPSALSRAMPVAFAALSFACTSRGNGRPISGSWFITPDTE